MRSKVAVRCVICGGETFEPGPKGRTSPGGQLPRCATCGSLERHRTFAAVLDALAEPLAGLRAIQFSPDPAARPERFGSFEVSVYGGPNSLDLARIDRPDGAYDLAIANHVLEHVEDDLAALAELDRITAPDGVVFLSVPDLLRVERTVEYGEARADKHGHWRVYGPDIRARWLAAAPSWRGLGVVAHDAVTGEADRSTLLSRSSPRLAALRAALVQHGFAPFDAFA